MKLRPTEPFTIESLRNSPVPEMHAIARALEEDTEHPYGVDDITMPAVEPNEASRPTTAIEAAARGGASRFNVQVQYLPRA